MFWGLLLSAASLAQTAVVLRAADGVQVQASHYKANPERALLLLFHQVSGNRGEYSGAIPRFVEEGFSVLAIDQRVGGDSFNQVNQTRVPLNKIYQRIDALADLEAALAWAKGPGAAKRIVVVGSSYSASLVFLLAAKYPSDIAGIMAYSPGANYIDNSGAVVKAAGALKMPVFVASLRSELSDAQPIYDALPAGNKVLFVPQGLGIHGAAALSNPLARNAYWEATLKFLGQFR